MKGHPWLASLSFPCVNGRKWQYAIALSVFLVGAASSVALYVVLGNQEFDGMRQQFEQRSQDRIIAASRTIDLDILELKFVQSFFASSQEVERDEFQSFVSPLTKKHPSIFSIEWAPRVPISKRSEFEKAAEHNGLSGFKITERDPGVNLSAAKERGEYYPVFYVEPSNSQAETLGFDVASNPACFEAMNRSCDMNQPAMTSRFLLPNERVEKVGVKVFVPIYRNNAPIDTVENRRKHLAGFVVGILRLEGIEQETFSSLTPAGIDVQLSDCTNASEIQRLYFHRSRLRISETTQLANDIPRRYQDLRCSLTLDAGGRQWKIVCTPSPQFIALETTSLPKVASVSCMLLTGFLVVYLFGIAHWNARLTQLASRLAQTNQRLEREMADRQEAESILWTNEIKHEALYDCSSEALMYLTPAKGMLEGNQACLELFGCKDQEEFTSCGPADLSPEYQPDGTLSSIKAQQMMAIAMREGSHFFEWTHKRRDGKDFYATVHLQRMEVDGNRMLQATVRDITPQKKAEAELRSSQKRLRLFAENVSDVIWTIDFSGQFSYVSPSVQKILGYTPESFTQFTLAQVMVPASFARAYGKLEKVVSLAKQNLRAETSTIELEMIRKDRSCVWCEVTFSGMYDESGRMIAIQGVSRDMTARKQMENELLQAKEAAEAANQAKSKFLANMSHEIRNPMTSILGYTDLLMDPQVNASSRNNYAAVIRRNVEHLLTLINDILDLSKIEEGKLSIDVRKCNLVSLLADVASVVRPRAVNRGISLSVEYQGDIPETILTDGSRLRQALINLAGNAVKFTEHGSVRIVTSCLPHGYCDQPAMKIEVIDTGIGIREEILPKLFQPFIQGDVSITQKFGGTGLGLAISHHIAHLLGGDLIAKSVWGQGSTFTLIVPAGNLQGVHMLPHPEEMEQEATCHVWETPGVNLGGVRILLAEDGYDNRELIQTILRVAGAEVETAENGRIAIEKAESNNFDVILMDMNMPEMDGLEATRWLRDRGYRRPILALTANAMEGDNELCRAAGCDEHLVKPIDRVRLVRTIATYIRGEHREEERDGGEVLPMPAMVPSLQDGVIVSQYADDPEMMSILEEFVDRLGGQVDMMRQTLSVGQYEELQRCAHKLKGAGGSYGYPLLTDACKVLEDAAKLRDESKCSMAIDAVAALSRAIQNGYTTSISSERSQC